MKFKYHNVLLPNGRWTVPGAIPLKRTETFAAIANYLYVKYPHWQQRKDITLLDVGSLEGGYAVLFTQMGFKVTMIEARQNNIKKSCEMASLMGMDIEMLAGDAKEILKQSRKWDVVVCAGVLYHLNKPVDFFDLLNSCSINDLIVSTHYSLFDDERYELPAIVKRIRRMIYKRIPGLFNKAEHNLSSLDLNEGFEGRWAKEYPEKAKKGEIEESALAAYSNHKSFWLTLQSLARLGSLAKQRHIKLRQDRIHHSICFVCSNG